VCYHDGVNAGDGDGADAGPPSAGSSSSWSHTAELGPGLSEMEVIRTGGVGGVPVSRHLIHEEKPGPSFSSGFPTHC